jgi:glycosyltransferase involved in cell wall biosynthesis
MGIGVLPERVRNGETGFVAQRKEEFIARTVALLSDDALWSSMHRECLADPALATWDIRAKEWENLFAQA